MPKKYTFALRAPFPYSQVSKFARAQPPSPKVRKPRDYRYIDFIPLGDYNNPQA